jgi:hypothetical protein
MRIPNMLRSIAVALALGLVPSLALAQSNPGFTFGQVPTPAQWNAAFSSKQDVLNFVPLNVAGGVMTGRLVTTPPSAAVAGFNLTPGSTPASPVNGDLWMTSVGLFGEVNGATVGPFAAAGTGTFTGTSPIVSTSPTPGIINYAFNFSIANTFLAQQTDQGATTTQPGWYAQLAGDTVARVRVGLNSTDVPSLAFGPGGSSNRDAFIERMGAGALRLGTADAAAPVAQSLSVQNVLAGTSNTAGANLTIDGSQGTGTGFGGNIVFQVAPAGSTGTAQNTLTTALTIFGANGGLSTGAAIDEGVGTLNLAGSLFNNGTAPTGTGAYVRATGASLVTPALGVASATSEAIGGCTIGSNALCLTGTFAFSAGGSFGGALTGITTAAMSGQLTSTLASGTPPFVVASTTNVPNLNASSLSGATFASPGSIGSGTAGSGAFTTLSASSTFALNNGGSLGGTISGTPTLSGANFVTRANLAQVAASSLSGNPTGSTTNESAITLGSTLNFSGTTLNCTAGSATQLGCVEPDNVTITVVGGKIVASGGSATAVTIGSTTIGGGTPGDMLAVTSTGCSGTAPCMTQVSGGWVLLNTLTAGSSATLSDTTSFTSNFNEYLLVFQNVLPATNVVTCEIQVQSGGSFQTTSYLGQLTASQTTSVVGQATTTYIPCSQTNAVSNSASGLGVSGEFKVFNPSSTTAPKNWIGQYSHASTGPNSQIGSMGGFWNSSAAITGFQALFSSGNITSGVIKVYGRL